MATPPLNPGQRVGIAAVAWICLLSMNNLRSEEPLAVMAWLLVCLAVVLACLRAAYSLKTVRHWRGRGAPLAPTPGRAALQRPVANPVGRYPTIGEWEPQVSR